MKAYTLAMVLVIAGAAVAQENPCDICPNGVTVPESEGDDHIPFPDWNLTCAEIVQEALTVESGTSDCGLHELNVMLVCCPPTEILNPCNMCPNGIAAGDL